VTKRLSWLMKQPFWAKSEKIIKVKISKDHDLLFFC